MNKFAESAYNAIEFVAFIVPRALQFVLDGLTHLNWIDNRFAMSMYIGMSYACASMLFFGSFLMVRRTIYSGTLVIGRQTYGLLIGAMMLIAFSGFTAVAPSTGLSLKHCAKAVAGFVTFDSR